MGRLVFVASDCPWLPMVVSGLSERLAVASLVLQWLHGARVTSAERSPEGPVAIHGCALSLSDRQTASAFGLSSHSLRYLVTAMN